MRNEVSDRSLIVGAIVAGIFGALAVAVAVIAGCSVPPEVVKHAPPPVQNAIATAAMDNLLAHVRAAEPAKTEALTAELVDVVPVDPKGGGRIAYTNSLLGTRWNFRHCTLDGGTSDLPILYVEAHNRRFTPGAQTEVHLLTTFLQPRPDYPVWFVLSTTRRDSPLALDDLGMPGCQLHLPLEHVELVLPGVEPFGNFSRGRGFATWRFTPGPEHVGMKVYLQGIAFAPGANRMGLLVTDSIECWCGSR